MFILVLSAFHECYVEIEWKCISACPIFFVALLYVRYLRIYAQGVLSLNEINVKAIKQFMEKFSDEDFFQLVIDEFKVCCYVLQENFMVGFSGMETKRPRFFGSHF